MIRKRHHPESESHEHHQTSALAKGAGITKDEARRVVRFWSEVGSGNRYRFYFPFMGTRDQFYMTKLRPSEDDIMSRLFDMCVTLNVFSGLVVSGLLQYVLAPDVPGGMEGQVCPVTGLSKETVLEIQMLLSHINLLLGMSIFGFTVFAAVLLRMDAESSSLRVVLKAETCMIGWSTVSFFQCFFIYAQAVLAATLYVPSPTWAKVVVAADTVVFFGLVFWCEHHLWQMFPVLTDKWLWCAPWEALKNCFSGNDKIAPLQEQMSQEARKTLQLPQAEPEDLPAQEQDRPLLANAQDRGASRNKMRTPRSDNDSSVGGWLGASSLRLFLKKALPHSSESRLQEILEAMTAEELTPDALQHALQVPHGQNWIYESLGSLPVLLSLGERLRIAAAASRADSELRSMSPKQPPAVA